MSLNHERGFSLIELLIVIALVGLLAGIAVPAISAGMERFRLISASQQVVSTIRAARWQAVAKNQILRVRFNYPDAGQYQVLDDANTAIGAVQYLLDGVTFDESVDLEISAEGRMTAASTIVVTNGDADQDRTISVTTSGRVYLQ